MGPVEPLPSEAPCPLKLRRVRIVPSVSTSASSRDESSSSECEDPTPLRRSKTIPGLGASKLYLALPPGLVVRNTFLDVEEEQLDFVPRRQTRSAPCSPQSRAEGLEEDTDAVSFIGADVIPGGPPDSDLAAVPGEERPDAAPAAPQLGSAELPTIGSQGHHLALCKPCAFVWKASGCDNGIACEYCHLCDPGEKKRRQKEKKASIQRRL